MSLPMDYFRENLLCGEVETHMADFEEGSKTKEHTDRFETHEISYNLKKNEDNQS